MLDWETAPLGTTVSSDTTHVTAGKADGHSKLLKESKRMMDMNILCKNAKSLITVKNYIAVGSTS